MKTSELSVSLLLVTAMAAMAQPAGAGGWGRGAHMEDLGPEGWIAAGPGSRTPVTGAPYSGVMSTQVQQTLTDGNQITRQQTVKMYRDGQGRVRMEQTAASTNGGTAAARISIFDPVAGYTHVLNPSAQTARKFALPAGRANSGAGSGMASAARRGRVAKAGDTQTVDLGTQTVNGQQATGTRITRTIPAGTVGNQQPIVIVRETWISTTLKIPVQIKSSDPRFGTRTMNLTNVVEAEPDATLFQVPASYTVTTVGRGAAMRRGPANN